MSSYFFSCLVTERSDKAKALIDCLSLAFWKRESADQDAARTILSLREDFKLPLMKLPLSLKNDVLRFEWEFSTSMDMVFFEGFVEALNRIDGVRYEAKLFDSSSGGEASWRKG